MGEKELKINRIFHVQVIYMKTQLSRKFGGDISDQN